MNDLYGAFAGAALDNYIQKADPRKFFSGNSQTSTQPDLESATPQSTNASFSQSLSNSIGNVKERFFSNGQPQQAPEQPSLVPAFILSKMSDQSDYPKALISFALAAVFALLAVLTLPTIIFSPQKFTMLFTLAVLSTVGGLAFINGPLSYVKKITSDRKNLINTGVLFGSMIFSLYFSIIAGSYLMSILLCLVELNAVLLFFCNTFPAGQLGMLKTMGSAAVTVVSAPFRR